MKVFYKKGVLKNLAKNHRKTSVPGSLLNKVAAWRHATLSKRDSGADVFLWMYKEFQEYLFFKHLQTDPFEEGY